MTSRIVVLIMWLSTNCTVKMFILLPPVYDLNTTQQAHTLKQRLSTSMRRNDVAYRGARYVVVDKLYSHTIISNCLLAMI